MSRVPIDANAVHAVSPARATTHQHAGRAAARRDELITKHGSQRLRMQKTRFKAEMPDDRFWHLIELNAIGV
jgi:hypothetical protein